MTVDQEGTELHFQLSHSHSDQAKLLYKECHTTNVSTFTATMLQKIVCFVFWKYVVEKFQLITNFP
jgi:hypothetical protein